MRARLSRRFRRGITAVQICILLSILVTGIVFTVSNLGQNVSDELGDTAGDVADPAQLVNRFGNNHQDTGSQGSSDQGGGSNYHDDHDD